MLMGFWLMALSLVMHPGHATRVELTLSADHKRCEVAMRIDALDIERALKQKHDKSFDVDSMNDDAAKDLIGSYLRDTILLSGRKLLKSDFAWVGWQREPTRIWIYFELPLKEAETAVNRLQMKSFFEVEPEIQHLFVIEDAQGPRTVIVRDADTAIDLHRS
jgi:hypothetical protein